jgi:hypothetical protein
MFSKFRTVQLSATILKQNLRRDSVQMVRNSHDNLDQYCQTRPESFDHENCLFSNENFETVIKNITYNVKQQ